LIPSMSSGLVKMKSIIIPVILNFLDCLFQKKLTRNAKKIQLIGIIKKESILLRTKNMLTV
jgi:hypothetical protein